MKSAGSSIIGLVIALFCLQSFDHVACGQMAASRPPLQTVECATGADFWVGGQPPNLVWPDNLAASAQHDKLVIWGSWCGDSARVGTLDLGPFVATKHFYMAVAGKPFADGNVLKIMHPADDDQLIITRDTPGNNWKQVEITLPDKWVGKNVKIFACDNSLAPDGWVAISEPYILSANGDVQPLWRDRTAGPRWYFWLHDTLGPLALIFILFAVVGISGYSILRRYLRTEPYLAPLMITAVVGLLGYLTFLAYWAGLDRIGPYTDDSILIFCAAYFLFCIFSRRKLLPVEDWQEIKWPALLVLIAALFNLGVLCFPRVEGTPFEVLASRRPCTWSLPSDNILQEELSHVMYLGEDPRTAGNPEWHTSDRPPLQAGVQLLLGAPLSNIFHFEWVIHSQLTGMLLQFSWIYGLWALLRAFGCSPHAASQIILCLIPTPVMYTHSVYIWAKLISAAYAMGVTAILCFRGKRPLTLSESIAAGVLVSLGMLCHSGIFFYLLPLIGLWFILPNPAGRPGWGLLFAVGIVAVSLFLPWTCYQKFFDPPGNHVLKLNFAGVIDDDSIPTTKTIRTAYSVLSWPTIVNYKMANFTTLFKGDWSTFFQLFPTNLIDRRVANFCNLFRSCGVFMLGVLTLPLLSLPRNKNLRRPFTFLLSSLTLSIIFWCLLMFVPGTTIIHAGAFGVPLVLLALLAVSLRLLHPAALLIVGLYNLVQFLWVYLWSFPYPPRIDSVAVALLCIAGALSIFLLIKQSTSAYSAQAPLGLVNAAKV